MKIDEYARFDGVGLAELVRNKDLSVLELLTTARKAVEVANSELNAVCDIFEDVFDQPVPEADQNAPFYGVPILIKDAVLHARGRLSENGSRFFVGAMQQSPGKLRVQVCLTPWISATIEPEIETAIRNVAATLEELGHQVTFAITPRESELLACLCKGEELAQYAAERQLSIHTARSQLKQLMMKVGAGRQADLVRIVLASPPAIIRN